MKVVASNVARNASGGFQLCGGTAATVRRADVSGEIERARIVMDDKHRPAAGRPKTFDRDRVVGVAMETYWSEGLDGISLNELCRRSGVSKPGLYREFGGEDGLMDATLAHYAETVLAPSLGPLMSGRPFDEVLVEVVETLTDIDRAGPAGCLLVRMQQSPARLGPTVAARVDALREGARSAYAVWVDEAKGRGEVPAGISTDVAAVFIDTQCSNLLVQMALGEDPESLRAQAALAFAGLTGSVPGQA